MEKTTFRAALSAAAAATLSAAGITATADAQIVLTVDASDPSAVVLTGTGVEASSESSLRGAVIQMDAFFDLERSAPLVEDVIFGENPLRPAQGGAVYDLFYRFREFVEFNGGGRQTQTFILGEAALIGTTVLDLSDYGLFSDDFIGEINVRDQDGNTVPETYVGQFAYTAPIPEPASAALLGLAGLATLRRRTR